MNPQDQNGWMVPCHDGYLEFPAQDDTPIAVTVWNHMISVKPHRHRFQEFALITKGYCIHVYKGISVPLIPGDVFLIEPDEEHSYEIQAPIELINCQFYPEKLEGECRKLMREMGCQEENYGYRSRQSQLNRQGIIHLDMKERQDIEFLLNCMMEEQKRGEEDMAGMKTACLQMILIKFRRNRKRKAAQIDHYKNSRKEKIYEILSYVEDHLAEEINFGQIAGQAGWSTGYFRAVFKDVTGMTPTEYLNRLRILKSLEYMQRDGLNVSEAAQRVGFLDPAYYSRLFKKIMGYAPRYFKN
ncbi:MAG: AraC family transcriptional regulator [Ruminococcus sp.]